MKDNITIFDKIMAAVTFAEANETLEFIKEEEITNTTISGVLEPIPI